MNRAASADLQTRIAGDLPTRAGLEVQAATIEDYSHELFSSELADISGATPSRLWEFSTGRWLARTLMARLGLPTAPLGRGPGREPLWPEDAIGSITHADGIAVVAVADTASLRGVGVDLEAWNRVTERLHRKLFTAAEQAILAQAPEQSAGLVFSAKEAGYKATFPLAGRFIGFQEAEIDVDWLAGRFAIRYLGAYPPNKVMEQGSGFFLCHERYVLSLFIIP